MSMDKIQFSCSGCKKGLSASVEKAGKTAKCPACGVAIQVPNAPRRQDDAPPGNLPQHPPKEATPADGRDDAGTLQPTVDKIKFACSVCGKAILAPADRA